MGSSNLAPCPDCGHLCSTAALTCPGCGRPHPHYAPEPETAKRDRAYSYVLTNSFMLVGLCLTLLGLVRLVEGIKNLSTLADELLAANAVIFLCSGLFAHFIVKDPDDDRRHRRGRVAEIIFTVGIVFLAGICCVVVVALV